METMKTPSDKQQPTKPTKEEVPVYELRFRQPYPDLGLPSMSGGVGVLRAKDGIKIAYLPASALFRIVHTPQDSKQKMRTVFFPREWAAFEAME